LAGLVVASVEEVLPASLRSLVMTKFMSKRFTITMSLCIVLFFVVNALRLLTGPPARVGVSGWRTLGFPFPVKIENVQSTATGPVVTVIKDEPWIWIGNVAVWLLLSYQFSRWVDRRGAAWWGGRS
jgi:hypothetical protein